MFEASGKPRFLGKGIGVLAIDLALDSARRGRAGKNRSAKLLFKGFGVRGFGITYTVHQEAGIIRKIAYSTPKSSLVFWCLLIWGRGS